MKYTYQPNVTVIDFINVKKIFQFNDKGEFETEDKNIIEFMAKHKSFIKCEDTKAKAKVKIDKSTKDNHKYKCKKCEFETENKGELLAHYRLHKKEE